MLNEESKKKKKDRERERKDWVVASKPILLRIEGVSIYMEVKEAIENYKEDSSLYQRSDLFLLWERWSQEVRVWIIKEGLEG